MLAAISRRPSGRPKRADADAIVDRIVETAGSLFKKHGYSATSIDQIARVAESGKQTIYRHFGSKEKLFETFIRREFADMVKELQKTIGRAEDPLTELRIVARHALDLMLKDRNVEFVRLMVSEAPRFPHVGRIFAEALEPLDRSTEMLIDGAIANGDLRAGPSKEIYNFLTGILTGWALNNRLLGNDVLEDETAQSAYFEAAWLQFLHGAGKGADGERRGAAGTGSVQDMQ